MDKFIVTAEINASLLTTKTIIGKLPLVKFSTYVAGTNIIKITTYDNSKFLIIIEDAD